MNYFNHIIIIIYLKNVELYRSYQAMCHIYFNGQSSEREKKEKERERERKREEGGEQFSFIRIETSFLYFKNLQF